mmetsp:Transcript_38243/g.85381  ORF Transcript_38243/g.85381 Transcript_38243/m.85381 type:complete len:204 (+) Transcript_38243:116-727(+)
MEHLRESALDLFIEAAEAVLHTILCVRNVYPRETFERRSLYGTTVWMSRSPPLCHYISTVLVNSKPLLYEGVAQKLVCTINDAGGQSIESYVIEVARLGAAQGNSEVLDEDTLLLDTEAQLRDLLLRTLSLEWQLSPIPTDCTFNILLHSRAKDSAETARALQSGSWLLASEPETCRYLKSGPISPLRSILTPGMHVQLYCVS